MQFSCLVYIHIVCDHRSHPSSEVFSSYRTETWYSGNSSNPFTFCLYKLNFSKFSEKKRNYSLSVFFGWLISFIVISTRFTCVLNLGQNWLSYKGRINWPLCIHPPFIYYPTNEYANIFQGPALTLWGLYQDESPIVFRDNLKWSSIRQKKKNQVWSISYPSQK